MDLNFVDPVETEGAPTGSSDQIMDIDIQNFDPGDIDFDKWLQIPQDDNRTDVSGNAVSLNSSGAGVAFLPEPAQQTVKPVSADIESHSSFLNTFNDNGSWNSFHMLSNSIEDLNWPNLSNHTGAVAIPSNKESSGHFDTSQGDSFWDSFGILEDTDDHGFLGVPPLPNGQPTFAPPTWTEIIHGPQLGEQAISTLHSPPGMMYLSYDNAIASFNQPSQEAAVPRLLSPKPIAETIGIESQSMTQGIKNKNRTRQLSRRHPQQFARKQEKISTIVKDVPKTFLGCFTIDPAHNSSRGQDELPVQVSKRCKKTCLRCHVYKIKCSGRFPCDMCLQLFSKRVTSRALSWRACFDSNLSELNIFNHCDKLEWDLISDSHLFSHLFGIGGAYQSIGLKLWPTGARITLLRVDELDEYAYQIFFENPARGYFIPMESARIQLTRLRKEWKKWTSDVPENRLAILAASAYWEAVFSRSEHDKEGYRFLAGCLGDLWLTRLDRLIKKAERTQMPPEARKQLAAEIALLEAVTLHGKFPADVPENGAEMREHLQQYLRHQISKFNADDMRQKLSKFNPDDMRQKLSKLKPDDMRQKLSKLYFVNMRQKLSKFNLVNIFPFYVAVLVIRMLIAFDLSGWLEQTDPDGEDR